MRRFVQKLEINQPFTLVRCVLLTFIIGYLILGFVKGFSLNTFKWLFLVAGLQSVMDGFENYRMQRSKRGIGFNIILGAIWGLAFFLL